MATSYGPQYPGIEDGLIFCFDPKNRKCWRGDTTIYNMPSLDSALGVSLSGSSVNIELSGDEWDGALTTKGYIEFDGTDDYISMNPNTGTTGPFALQEFTVSCWVEPVMPSTGGGWNSYLFFNMDAGEVNGWSLMISLYPKLRAYDSGGAKEAVGPADIPSVQWYNYTGVKQATGLSNNLSLYQDGAIGPTVVTCTDITYAATTYTPQMGSNAGGKELEGKLGPVMIWNRALSAAEILTNYNRLKGRFGL